MAGLLRRDRPFVGVEVLLLPDVEFILRRSWKHVEQFSVVRHGRTPALSKPVYCLFLFRSRGRYDFKSRLRKQGFFPGDFISAGCSRFGCGH